MTMDINDFDSAVATAVAELGDAPDPEAIPDEDVLIDPAEPEVEDQAEVAEAPDTETPDETTEPDLFEDVEIEPLPTEPIEGQTFQVVGVDQPVTLQELKDGYMRQQDATRKWQEAAEMRKQNDRAIKFWTALEADPMAVARTIAEQAGLIEQGAAPQVQLDISPLRTSEQVEAEINRRVEEAVANHPVVQEATATKLKSWIEGQFTHIETLAGRKLSAKDRSTILRKAAQLRVTDLEVVFNALVAETARKRAGAELLAAVAPARQTSRAVVQEITTPAESFEEAAERAKVQVATKRR